MSKEEQELQVCKYHPEYDHTSGDPVGNCFMDECGEIQPMYQSCFPNLTPKFPCPYCLQARVKWLAAPDWRKLCGSQLKTLKIASKRIAKLKQQLAIAIKKAEGTYGLAKLDLENQIAEAKERETVLTQQLKDSREELEKMLQGQEDTEVLMRLKLVRVDQLHREAVDVEQELERVKGELAERKILTDARSHMVIEMGKDLVRAKEREVVLDKQLADAKAKNDEILEDWDLSLEQHHKRHIEADKQLADAIKQIAQQKGTEYDLEHGEERETILREAIRLDRDHHQEGMLMASGGHITREELVTYHRERYDKAKAALAALAAKTGSLPPKTSSNQTEGA